MSNGMTIHLQFELDLLYFEDVITNDEYQNLVSMIKSPDKENHVLAILALQSFKKRAHEKRK